MANFRLISSETLNWKMHERFIIPTITVGWTIDSDGWIVWFDIVFWKWKIGLIFMSDE